MDMPKNLSWRKSAAFWPIDLRERYGRMCNRFEDEGIPFPLSEWKAFQLVVEFLRHHEKNHPDKPIQFVLPYHDRAIDEAGNTVWLPRKFPEEVNFDNSFELDPEAIPFLNALSKALQSIKLHKKKLSEHAKSISQSHKTVDPKKMSPDELKVIPVKRARGRRFKHSDKNKSMF